MRLQSQGGQGSGEPTKHNYEKWCCSWNSLQNGQHRLAGAFKALQRIQDPDTSDIFTMFSQCFHNEEVIVQKDYVHLCASMSPRPLASATSRSLS